MKKFVLILSFLMLTTKGTSNDKEYCDIKGFVNLPGMYEIKENYTIQDIIINAGGLKKDAYTDNINLSKKVTDEMVIYIFGKDEIDKIYELNNCECKPIYIHKECEEKSTTQKTTTKTTQTKPTTTSTTSQTTSKPSINIITTIPTTITTYVKININTASLEELMTIKGLGEVKAKKIIEYRENNGLFKNIESLLGIDGIGTTTFEKIKDYIEI